MIPSLPYDGPGTLLAAALCLPLLLAPGAVFAQGLDAPGWAQARTRLDRMAVAALCSVAGLPVLLDLAGRFGSGPMLGLALALAAPGILILARRAPERTPPRVLALTALAVALHALFVVAMLVDWPVPGGAVQSLMALDYVKHAAATWAIAEAGTPPYNPAFLAPGEPASYYYFFYTLTAVIERAGFGLISGREASFGLAIWTGPLLFALARLVYAQARLAPPDPDAPRAEPWLVLLLLTTGLDLIGIAALGLLPRAGAGLAGFEQWNTPVDAWLTSALWVPHHVAALAAALVGLMALAAEHEAPPRLGRSLRRVVLAGLAFASLAGLSIYVALGLGAGLLLWLGRLVLLRHGASLARTAAAGLLALALAGSWLATIVRGRVLGGGPAPLAVEIRRFPLLDSLVPDDGPAQGLVDLLALPLSYGLEFGAFAVGAALFWRLEGRRGFTGELSVLLALCAGAALLVGSFVKSAVLFNDLGTRVMLFPQLALLLWTLAAIQRGLLQPGLRALVIPPRARDAFVACLAISLVGEVLGMVQFRRNATMTGQDVALLPFEREAWSWLAAHLPRGTVVQEHPRQDFDRALGYGLYGHFPSAVADHANALLFGGSEPAIRARIARLIPVFADTELPAGEAMAVSAAERIGILVITGRDPVFAAPAAWPRTIRPVYANPGVMVFAVPGPEAAR
ncbi:hypothetical protein [Methylobacterium sp. ID0610]|uniref:hypothetical protein n=1 Tax=Methylobacterium carpenticola TaxID=3344827 RepID=UPI00368F24AD